MQSLEIYRGEDYQLRIRGAPDGVLDVSDPVLIMAFVGPDRKPIRLQTEVRIFAWRIKRNTFVAGYAPPISTSTCLSPVFSSTPKGLITTDQAEIAFAQLEKLGLGPYMLQIEAEEYGTGLLLRDAMEIGLF